MARPLKDHHKSWSFSKTLIYSLVPLIVLVIFLETGARIVYYQVHGTRNFALVAAVYSLKNKLALAGSQKTVKDVKEGLPKRAETGLFSPEGKPVLAYFKKSYENNFVELLAETDKLGSKLIVLYIPSIFQKNSPAYDVGRTFFRSLAGKYRVDFVDLTEAFAAFSPEVVTLLPQNGHLSRFGNQVVVKELCKHLEKYGGHRMRVIFPSRPAVLGDLLPKENKIWQFAPLMPYRVGVNSQGLRMDKDLEFPKKKPRILCLGDSFTFGPYLPNHDTYPGLLQQKYPDKDVINAGICGYTIEDEVSLYKERAKYCEPDIIVLQVLDNDLWDFFYFKRQTFDRARRDFKPSAPEEAYFARLRSLEEAAKAQALPVSPR